MLFVGLSVVVKFRGSFMRDLADIKSITEDVLASICISHVSCERQNEILILKSENSFTKLYYIYA